MESVRKLPKSNKKKPMVRRTLRLEDTGLGRALDLAVVFCLFLEVAVAIIFLRKRIFLKEKKYTRYKSKIYFWGMRSASGAFFQNIYP